MEASPSADDASKPTSPFQQIVGAFQSSDDAEVRSPVSDEGKTGPGLLDMDRMRSTLATESQALPVDVKPGGFRMPKLSPRGISPKVKRNASILKLLRKPKPHWKEMLKGKHSEGSSASKLSTIEQGDEVEEGSQRSGQDEGDQLDSHHSMTPDIISQNWDLHVHVVCARGLRAADSNGLSDPYTVVRLGARSEQTRVVPESLDPDWNEAFVFSADDIEAGIMETGPRLLFEVWDSDIGVVADDFLGQATVDLTDIRPEEDGQVFRLPLYLSVKGELIDSGLGFLEVAILAKQSAGSASGSGQANGQKSATSALCPVPGQIQKSLPAVIHDERGNTLYEEPCIAWLHIRIVQVAVSQSSSEGEEVPLLAKLFNPGTASSRWRSLTGLRRSMSRQPSSSSTASTASVRETLQPSPRFKERRSLHRVISDGDEGGNSSASGLRGMHRRIKRLFGKTDGEEEVQAADDCDVEQESESEESEGEDEAGEEQLLYWEVSVGNQTKRSRLAPLQGGRAKWGQDFAFAVVLPLRTRPLRLELHHSSSNRRKGRTLARAFIPLATLFPEGSTEIGSDGEWFRLHAGASSGFGGAVALAAACVDTDFRRGLYGLPIAVPPEQRLTRHSVQASEASASSLQRASMGSGDSGTDKGAHISIAERLRQSSGAWSILPDPARTLDTCREQSNELASSSGKSSGKSSSGKSRGTASAQDAKEAGDAPESGQIASGSTPLEEATEPAPGKTATWPLPWLTWFAQKLYAQRPEDAAKPVQVQSLGMLQLVINGVDLEQGSDSCFCLLRCGPLWGRSTTQPSSPHLDFNWEVHAPIFDPGEVLQLALFRETGPRTSRRTQLVGLLRLRLSSLATDALHCARLPLCASRKAGGDRAATVDLCMKVMYTSRLALMRKYLSPLQPTGIYRHGLAGGDVRHALERETARIIMRWLESSGPPVPRAVADCLLRSPKDVFLMSRTKAHWRRLSVWVESFKQMGEGWAYLQTWDNPPATMGTMAGMTALCCYPHITVSLAATALVIYMVFAYPRGAVGQPLPMEPDPEAKEDDDDNEDNELQGTLVQRLQRRVENMQRIALKVQNALDAIASALERGWVLVCWADPNASAFFLMIATVAALLVALLGLHTLVSILLCWMLRPPFLRVPRPPPPYSFLMRLPNKADQIP